MHTRLFLFRVMISFSTSNLTKHPYQIEVRIGHACKEGYFQQIVALPGCDEGLLFKLCILSNLWFIMYLFTALWANAWAIQPTQSSMLCALLREKKLTTEPGQYSTVRRHIPTNIG